jgi:hypothetical protein
MRQPTKLDVSRLQQSSEDKSYFYQITITPSSPTSTTQQRIAEILASLATPNVFTGLVGNIYTISSPVEGDCRQHHERFSAQIGSAAVKIRNSSSPDPAVVFSSSSSEASFSFPSLSFVSGMANPNSFSSSSYAAMAAESSDQTPFSDSHKKRKARPEENADSSDSSAKAPRAPMADAIHTVREQLTRNYSTPDSSQLSNPEVLTYAATVLQQMSDLVDTASGCPWHTRTSQ